MIPSSPIRWIGRSATDSPGSLNAGNPYVLAGARPPTLAEAGYDADQFVGIHGKPEQLGELTTTVVSESPNM